MNAIVPTPGAKYDVPTMEQTFDTHTHTITGIVCSNIVVFCLSDVEGFTKTVLKRPSQRNEHMQKQDEWSLWTLAFKLDRTSLTTSHSESSGCHQVKEGH